MTMRVSTASVINSYKRQLSTSTSKLDEARNRVLTQRKFSKGSEDPISALKSMKLRTEYQKNEDYMENIKNQQSNVDSAEAAMMQIVSNAKTVSKEDVLSAVTGTSGPEDRKLIASTLRKMQTSMLASANATYDGKYLFNGSHGGNIPFDADGGTVTFNGVNVSAADGSTELDQLKDMADEKTYIDLGLGVTVNDTTRKVDDASAFQSSWSGADLFGYGVDENGTSKNMFQLIGEMADVLEADDFDSDKLWELADSFQTSTNSLIGKVGQLGVQSNYLENTLTRYETKQTTLNTQISNVEDVDFSEAYTDFTWTTYAYQAALKVGNSILSNSFIDFMS